jgi:hypothetical protein
MLRKRNSGSAVRKFVAAALSALAMVVLCVSCGDHGGEYLGKAGTKDRCKKMAEASCSLYDKEKNEGYTFIAGSHECYCGDF